MFLFPVSVSPIAYVDSAMAFAEIAVDFKPDLTRQIHEAGHSPAVFDVSFILVGLGCY